MNVATIPVVIAKKIFPLRDWALFFKDRKVFCEDLDRERDVLEEGLFLYVSDDLFVHYHWERLLQARPMEEADLFVYGDGRGRFSLSPSGDFSIRKIPREEHVDGLHFAGISLLRDMKGRGTRRAVLAERKWEKKKGAFFLDRDGILVEGAFYSATYGEIVPKKDFLTAFSKLVHENTFVFVVSNQSGVGRGLFSEGEVRELHQRLEQDFKTFGLSITEWAFCPYHKTFGKGEFQKDSFSRKPYPGMVLHFCEKYPIDLNESWMIGDRVTDDLFLPQLKTLHLKSTESLAKATSAVFASSQDLVDHIRSYGKNR
ncbi:MAG: HAD-IIIA family hydrolase [Bacteriovoracales bacterium]|nr:HAD-IIIA family hydrolase [Bacteriovoracales bacterium]